MPGVGPAGFGEAVFIYCCSAEVNAGGAALPASGQGGAQREEESPMRRQRSESREGASLEQPVMRRPGGQVGQDEV